jgi:putative tricarboxylic transport membrane protein
VNRLPADLYFMAAFGFVDLMLAKLGFEAAPLLLGFVLGDALEANFRRTLILADGDWVSFVRSPISVALFAAVLALLATMLLPRLRQRHEVILAEEK